MKLLEPINDFRCEGDPVILKAMVARECYRRNFSTGAGHRFGELTIILAQRA